MTRVTQSSSSEPSFFSAPYVEEFLEGCITGAVVGAITHVALSRFNLDKLMPALNSLNFYGTCELAKKLLKGEKLADSMPKFWGEMCGGFLVGGLISQLCEGVLAVRSPQYSVLGKYKGGVGAPPVVPSSELGTSFKSGERKIFGYTRAEYLAEMKNFRELSPEARIKYSLESAKNNRADFTLAFPDKDLRFLFSHSRLGAHHVDLLQARRILSTIPELQNGSLRLASYGPGFNDSCAFLENSLPAHSFARSMLPGLKTKEAKVFPFHLRGQSYEPRELERLFLQGREGSVSAFDIDSRVHQSLKSPLMINSDAFKVIDKLGGASAGAVLEREGIESYWYEDILRGEVSRQELFLATERGNFYFDIAEFPGHLKTIQGFQECLVTSPRMDYSSNPFGFSVWLDSFYFFPKPLQQIAFARIVRNTRPHGLILTDYVIDIKQEARYGVYLLGAIKSPYIPGNPVTSYLYQRNPVLSEEIDILARLNI